MVTFLRAGIDCGSFISHTKQKKFSRVCARIIYQFGVCCEGEVCRLLFWLSTGLIFDMSEVESAPDWLLEKLCTETEERLITIVTTPLGLWFARNRRIWEGKSSWVRALQWV